MTDPNQDTMAPTTGSTDNRERTSQADRLDGPGPHGRAAQTTGGKAWLILVAVAVVIAAAVAIPKWRDSAGAGAGGVPRDLEAQVTAEAARVQALALAARWETAIQRLPSEQHGGEAADAGDALATGRRHFDAGAYGEAEVAFRRAADLYETRLTTLVEPQGAPVDMGEAASELSGQLDGLELRLHGRIAEAQQRVEEQELRLRQSSTVEEQVRVRRRKEEAEAELALLSRLKALAYAHAFNPSLRSDISRKLTEADRYVEDERHEDAEEIYAALGSRLEALLGWPDRAEAVLRQYVALIEENGELRSKLGPMGLAVEGVNGALDAATGRLERGSDELDSGRISRAVELLESARRSRLDGRALAIDGLLAAARSSQEEGKLTVAALALNELLSLDPEHVEGRALRDVVVSDRVTNSIGMELAFVPPGEFVMGSPATELGRDEDERQRRVVVDAGFHLGVAEVRQSQWMAVMDGNPSSWEGDDLPVEGVLWEDAVEFCERLSEKEGRVYRLPTEVEWEYACRAGTTTPFALGMVISTEQANFDGEYPYGNAPKGVFRNQTLEVRTFPANPWGFFDMHGNVWEWCLDAVDAPAIGSAAERPAGEPVVAHVLRGGSWRNRAKYCRSGNRVLDIENSRLSNIGFRVVLESD